jgi:hypothetical protein
MSEEKWSVPASSPWDFVAIEIPEFALGTSSVAHIYGSEQDIDLTLRSSFFGED